MITLHLDKNHTIIFNNAAALNDAAGNQLIAHALDAMGWSPETMSQALSFMGRWDKERLIAALYKHDEEMVEKVIKSIQDEE